MKMETLTTPLSLSEQNVIVAEIKTAILEGELDPLKVHIALKSIELIMKNIINDYEIKGSLLDEAEKNGKSFKMFNAKISIVRRKKWDFSVCSDSVYTELEEKKNNVAEKIKKRKNFLQSLSAPIADTETGEIISPASYTETPLISVSFKGYEYDK